MTREQFREALAAAGEKYVTDENALRKRARSGIIIKSCIIGAAVVFAAGAVLSAVLIFNASADPSGGNPSDALVNVDPEVTPSETQNGILKESDPAETPFGSDSCQDNSTPGPSVAPSETETGFNVKMLSFQSLEDELVSFGADAFSTRLISSTVKGEHEFCSGVFYDQQTGKIVCFEHEFLSASGMPIPEGCHLDFAIDAKNKNLAAVMIREQYTSRLADLWILDRKSGTASRVPLPGMCADYSEVGLWSRGLRGGMICLSVNTKSGGHFLYMCNSETGEAFVLTKSTGNSFVYGEFLADGILSVHIDGESYFYNTDDDMLTKTVGEYNYCNGGVVFSVRSWGGARHNDVVVAAYDAVTGEALDNMKVIALSFDDNGDGIFILKNTSGGDETVIFDDYIEPCYGWNDDFSYFYAYSEKNSSLLVFDAARQIWETVPLERVPKEPEVINGRTHVVYVSYYLAIGDGPGDVTIYYKRTLWECKETPDYDDEKVDSPYWDEYRDIKFRNFADETSFEYADKSGICDNCVYGREIRDMTLLRDIILECLEAKGSLYKDYRDTNDEGVMVGHLYCRNFRIIFRQYGDTLCISMPRNVSPLADYNDSGSNYVFPESVFRDIEKRIGEYFEAEKIPKTNETYEPQIMTDIDDLKTEDILRVYYPTLSIENAVEAPCIFELYRAVYSDEKGDLLVIDAEPLPEDEEILCISPVFKCSGLLKLLTGTNARVMFMEFFDVYGIPESSVSLDTESALYSFDGPMSLGEAVSWISNVMAGFNSYEIDCMVLIKVRVDGKYIPEIDRNEYAEFLCCFRVQPRE